MQSRLSQRAPGVYELPDEPVRALTGVGMDVCAFAGVAPRGPASAPYFRLEGAPVACGPERTEKRTVAVPVDSFSDYQRMFGAFEGPGLLPYAVASFFENGGRRAYVLRVVHDYAGADTSPSLGVARASLGGVLLTSGREVALRARDPGSWGNQLAATLTFAVRPLLFDAASATLSELVLPRNCDLAVGALLRVALAGGVAALRYVSFLRDELATRDGALVRRATLDAPLPSLPRAAEVVEGTFQVNDGAGRSETIVRVGLSSDHPRWLARVLIEESGLVYPDERDAFDWLGDSFSLAPLLPPFATTPFVGGQDRYADIVPEDFFSDWVAGDECAGDGVHAVVDVGEIALLCVPDLYSPAPLVPIEDVVSARSLAGAEFGPCLDVEQLPVQALPVQDLAGLRLDPATDLATIIDLQRRLLEFADTMRAFVVLLDVPPSLSQSRIVAWRAQLNSEFSAAYHPWLDVARADDRRDALIRVNPSAVAAGVIAQRELERGIAHGPANVLAAGVVRVADVVSLARHDALHPLGINVYVPERDGVRLSAARTLSLDPDYRQLSVRRLVTMLERVLDRQMQWMVFEPNTPKLRRNVAHVLTLYLRQLFHANAFSGQRESEAFFVRCDDELNPPSSIANGRLLAEVGVAPAEPLEFILLRISRDGDGTLRVGGG